MSKMKNRAGVSGTYTLTVEDKFGKVKQQCKQHNALTPEALAYLLHGGNMWGGNQQIGASVNTSQPATAFRAGVFTTAPNYDTQCFSVTPDRQTGAMPLSCSLHRVSMNGVITEDASPMSVASVCLLASTPFTAAMTLIAATNGAAPYFDIDGQQESAAFPGLNKYYDSGNLNTMSSTLDSSSIMAIGTNGSVYGMSINNNTKTASAWSVYIYRNNSNVNFSLPLPSGKTPSGATGTTSNAVVPVLRPDLGTVEMFYTMTDGTLQKSTFPISKLVGSLTAADITTTTQENFGQEIVVSGSIGIAGYYDQTEHCYYLPLSRTVAQKFTVDGNGQLVPAYKQIDITSGAVKPIAMKRQDGRIEVYRHAGSTAYVSATHRSNLFSFVHLDTPIVIDAGDVLRIGYDLTVANV
jgi:hypothetical protein